MDLKVNILIGSTKGSHSQVGGAEAGTPKLSLRLLRGSTREGSRSVDLSGSQPSTNPLWGKVFPMETLVIDAQRWTKYEPTVKTYQKHKDMSHHRFTCLRTTNVGILKYRKLNNCFQTLDNTQLRTERWETNEIRLRSSLLCGGNFWNAEQSGWTQAEFRKGALNGLKR